MKFSFFNLCISFAVFKISNSQRPLVLIHGLLGSFKDFDNFTEMVQADFPDITILPLDAFNGRASWVSIVQQISWFSRLVEKITQKYEDITLLGYSQGGFIARGILEMSDNPHIHTLISLAGPVMGLYGFPLLPNPPFSNISNDSMSDLCYQTKGQSISTCGYWKDPRPGRYQEYLQYSEVLPYLNNELEHLSSARYKQNFLSVEMMVMIGSISDEVITPWQSSQYGFFNDQLDIVEMQDQPLYKDDSFGLRTLDEEKKLKFCTMENTTHAQFLHRDVYEKCIRQYIN